MNNAYKKFAYYYDDAISEIDYDLWLEFIEPYLNKDSKILDLACGSGTLAILLKLEGYNVSGLDLSESIIEIAKEKAKINHLNIPFYVDDMANFNLNEKFDVITCFFDSINFLQNEELVIKTFNCVKKHLNKGGIFICDVFSLDMLDEYLNNEIIKDFQTYKLVWKTKKVTDLCLVHNIEIYDKLDSVTLKENYYEYYYDLEKLNIEGFSLIKKSGDFNDDYLEGDERLIFVYKIL